MKYSCYTIHKNFRNILWDSGGKVWVNWAEASKWCCVWFLPRDPRILSSFFLSWSPLNLSTTGANERWVFRKRVARLFCRICEAFHREQHQWLRRNCQSNPISENQAVVCIQYAGLVAPSSLGLVASKEKDQSWLPFFWLGWLRLYLLEYIHSLYLKSSLSLTPQPLITFSHSLQFDSLNELRSILETRV